MLTRAVLLLVLAAALAGCGSTKECVFHLQPDHPLSSADVGRSMKVIQKRLVALGEGGTAARLSRGIVVRFGRPTLPAGLAAASGIEFFDLESAIVAGPRTSPPQARPGTELVTCSAAETSTPTAPNCPKTTIPSQTYYYLFKKPPAMTGADLQSGATRVAHDPAANQSVLVISFTPAGARAFRDVTRTEAQRGMRKHQNQSFAIVFDGELISFPYVDYKLYPNGINSGNDAEIAGTTFAKEEQIRAVLRAGTLPASFHVVG